MSINEYIYNLDNMLSVRNEDPATATEVVKYHKAGVSYQDACSIIISTRKRADWLDAQATK